jgi:hypothetical protein
MGVPLPAMSLGFAQQAEAPVADDAAVRFGVQFAEALKI